MCQHAHSRDNRDRYDTTDRRHGDNSDGGDDRSSQSVLLARPEGRQTRASRMGRIDRRHVLLGAGATLATLAGCGTFQSGGVPDPVTLTTEDSCDVCGMVIPNHPGPSTEIFYASNRPSGHDNPAHFDSTWEAFQYHFDRLDQGWTAEVFYVTDYSSVEYSVFKSGPNRLISTHPRASAFVDAETVTFVVGSGVKGAMGRDLIAFSKRDDAESFRNEYGGSLASFDEVSRETIAQLGQS